MVDGDDLIGCTYGTILEVTKDGCQVTTMHSLQQDSHKTEVTETKKDNRNFTIANNTQNLTWEDIEYEKFKGKTGEEMIEKIVQGSKTFADKTEFSKEKYMKKLKNKYIHYVEL